MNLEVDAILMKHPRYIEAYGKVGISATLQLAMTNTLQNRINNRDQPAKPDIHSERKDDLLTSGEAEGLLEDYTAAGVVKDEKGADTTIVDSKRPTLEKEDSSAEYVLEPRITPPQTEQETSSAVSFQSSPKSTDESKASHTAAAPPFRRLSLDLGSDENDFGLVITAEGLSRANFDELRKEQQSDESNAQDNDVTTNVDNRLVDEEQAGGDVPAPIDGSQELDIPSPVTGAVAKPSPRPLSFDSFYGVSIRAPSVKEAKEPALGEKELVLDEKASSPFEDTVSWPSNLEPSKEHFSSSLSGPFQWHLDDLSHVGPEPPLPPKSASPNNDGAPPLPKRPPPPIPQLSVNSAHSESDESAMHSDGKSLPIPHDGSDSNGYGHRRSTSSNDGSSLAWSEQSYSHSAGILSPETVISPILTTSPTPPRVKAQLQLQELQLQLAEAKAKGDSKGAQQSLEKSIQIIHQTYLPSATSRPPVTWPPIAKPSSRGSLLRLPSLAHFANRGKRPQVQALFNAVRCDDVPTIKDHLSQGVSVNVRSEDFDTPLMQAATHGKLRSLEILKHSGADEFAVNGKGQTVLHLAIATKQMYSVQWLLEAYHSTDTPATNPKPWRLSRSPSSLSLRSSKILRETSDKEGFRPMHVAASQNLTELLEVLIADGAVIEARNNWGGTPLHAAIFTDSLDTARVLISRSAEVDVVDVNGMSPLHWAAKLGHTEALHLLIKAGSKSSYSGNGDLPIHVAIQQGQLSAVQDLMFHGTGVEAQTSRGDTLLVVAIISNQFKIAEYLLQQSANANPFSRFGPSKMGADGTIVIKRPNDRSQPPSTTPLHFACFAGWYEMAALLLDHQALVNVPNCDGKSPLILATEADDTNLVYLLIARGAKVNATIPSTMWTALHIASQKGNLETLQKLYQSGANVHARATDMRIPEEHAHRCADASKQQAMRTWYTDIRNARLAKARQHQQENRPNGAPAPQVPGFNYVVDPPPPHNNLALIQQLSPPNQYYDPQYDSFPDAPPPYVAGPSAPTRLAHRTAVHRPPGS